MNLSAGLAVQFFDFSVTLFLKLGIETRKIAPFNPQFLKNQRNRGLFAAQIGKANNNLDGTAQTPKVLLLRIMQ